MISSANSIPSFPAWRDERAAQLVEFAVALPLLVLFVVGIFDFSGAYTLKQKLTNIARDSARAAAADPSNDLVGYSGSFPASVSDAYQLIDNYFFSNHFNECGLAPSGANTPPSLTWTFTASGNGCPAPGLKIIINRGYYFPQGSGATLPDVTCTSQASAGQIAIVSTCVSIQYAYGWRFGRASSLFGSGGGLPQQISAVAVSMNQN